jgi:hypothetical protein
LVFYCHSFFPLFLSLFWLVCVSSLAYPNLFGTKGLGCRYCRRCCKLNFHSSAWKSELSIGYVLAAL